MKYHNCKWCGGSGCLACEGEADKEYQKQFPNGPEPIATFKTDSPEDMEHLKSVMGSLALESISKEADQRASEIIANNPFIKQLVVAPDVDIQKVLSSQLIPEIMIERIRKSE